MKIKLNLIAAACENMGIGKNNNLPWKLKTEMEFFTRMTTKTVDPNKKNVVIMGRKTWDSIPNKFKPLKNRIHFILSRSDLDLDGFNDVYSFKSFNECIDRLNDQEFTMLYENVWVVGGSHIYKESMESDNFFRLYMTKILRDFDCDTFFPKLPDSLEKISDPDVPDERQCENGIEFVYNVYQNPTF